MLEAQSWNCGPRRVSQANMGPGLTALAAFNILSNDVINSQRNKSLALVAVGFDDILPE